MNKREIEEFEKEWNIIAAQKIPKPEVEEKGPEYTAKMTKGADILLSERDVDLIKRKAKRGFSNPIYRVYGLKSNLKHPDQLINFKKLVCVKKVGDYDDRVKKWKKNRTRCTIIVETGPNIMISDNDFMMFDKRSNKFDVTPIIELSGSIDGTVLINLNHVIHAYRKTYDGLMSKEKFAALKVG